MEHAVITITIPERWATDFWEQLEDNLRDFLYSEGIRTARIDDTATGNTTMVTTDIPEPTY